MVTTIPPPHVPVPLVADPSVYTTRSKVFQLSSTRCNAHFLSASASPDLLPEVSKICSPICIHGGRSSGCLAGLVFPKIDSHTASALARQLGFFVRCGAVHQQSDDAGFRVQSFSTFLGLWRRIVWLSCQFLED